MIEKDLLKFATATVLSVGTAVLTIDLFRNNLRGNYKLESIDLNNDGRLDLTDQNGLYLIQREDRSYDKCTIFAVDGMGFFKSENGRRSYDSLGHVFDDSEIIKNGVK